MNTFSVKDRVMVITGGTNGIGRGLTDYFVEQGAQVIALGSREETVQIPIPPERRNGWTSRNSGPLSFPAFREGNWERSMTWQARSTTLPATTRIWPAGPFL